MKNQFFFHGGVPDFFPCDSQSYVMSPFFDASIHSARKCLYLNEPVSPKN